MLLPHPPGDELIVLGAEIDNQDHLAALFSALGDKNY